MSQQFDQTYLEHSLDLDAASTSKITIKSLRRLPIFLIIVAFYDKPSCISELAISRNITGLLTKNSIRCINASVLSILLIITS